MFLFAVSFTRPLLTLRLGRAKTKVKTTPAFLPVSQFDIITHNAKKVNVRWRRRLFRNCRSFADFLNFESRLKQS